MPVESQVVDSYIKFLDTLPDPEPGVSVLFRYTDRDGWRVFTLSTDVNSSDLAESMRHSVSPFDNAHVAMRAVGVAHAYREDSFGVGEPLSSTPVLVMSVHSPTAALARLLMNDTVIDTHDADCDGRMPDALRDMFSPYAN